MAAHGTEVPMPNDLSTPALVFAQPPAKPSPAWAAIGGLYRADETQVVERLLAELALPADQLDRIAERARGLVAEVRRQRVGKGGLDAFLHEYALSSQEGVVLMCLAEALLRIPDAETADLLIRDKLRLADWEKHLGKSDSLFVNASTWALMLTGRVVKLGEFKEKDLSSLLGRLVGRCASGAASSSWAAPSRRPWSGPGPRSPSAIAIPMTCAARRRVRPRTPSVTSRPMTRPSRP